MKHKGNILSDLSEQQTICITTAIHTKKEKKKRQKETQKTTNKFHNITETQNCHSFTVNQTLSSKRPMIYYS